MLNPGSDQRDIDLSYAVVAHEVAHQWWGATLTPARVEGAAVLTESLAWYSAFQLVERTQGREHLWRLLRMMREVYATPRSGTRERGGEQARPDQQIGKAVHLSFGSQIGLWTDNQTHQCSQGL